MTLRKALTLLASYFGFIAALTVVVCLAFGTRIRSEKDIIGQREERAQVDKKTIKNSRLTTEPKADRVFKPDLQTQGPLPIRNPSPQTEAKSPEDLRKKQNDGVKDTGELSTSSRLLSNPKKTQAKPLL